MISNMIVIGNPDNRRTRGLQEARAKLGLQPAAVLAYAELLQEKRSLSDVVRAHGWSGEREKPLLRLDAPGENFEVERALIGLGAPDCPAPNISDRLVPFGDRPVPMPMSWERVLRLKEERGRVYHPSQWFRGFGRLLARLDEEAAACWPSGGNWLNAPAEVMAMFDKRRTYRILQQAGVSVAPLLQESDEQQPGDYEALREAMLARRMHRVFVKLASGSGASGVMAYQMNPRTGQEMAITTMELQRYLAKPPGIYNQMKLRKYTRPADIRILAGWLLKHGAHVERWVSKASYQGAAYDIRQLVVCGQACHSIARVSKTPITNLHLRSERLEIEKLGLASEVLQSVRSSAENALAAFPGSRVAGIDVIVDSAQKRPYVIDVNPFGDLIYHVLHEGCSTYEWELRQLVSRS